MPIMGVTKFSVDPGYRASCQGAGLAYAFIIGEEAQG